MIKWSHVICTCPCVAAGQSHGGESSTIPDHHQLPMVCEIFICTIPKQNWHFGGENSTFSSIWLFPRLHRWVWCLAHLLLCYAAGPKRDNNKARDYICEMFMEAIPLERVGDIYPHFTCATDTNNIKTIFEAVKNHILQVHIHELVGVGM